MSAPATPQSEKDKDTETADPQSSTMATPTATIPTAQDSATASGFPPQDNNHLSSTSSSTSSLHEDEQPKPLTRPKMSSRKGSGSIIIPRDRPDIELQEGDEIFDPDDARCMSPRRNSEDLEKMSREARAVLSQHAKVLHDSLLALFNRIEAVKEEHDKLDSNNKFLQKYIGDLMSTSKITSTGGASSTSASRKK